MSEKQSTIFGVSAEERSQFSKAESRALRARSRRLLLALCRPHVPLLLGCMVALIVTAVTRAALPLIVAYGIDHVLPSLTPENAAPAFYTGALYLVCALSGAGLLALYVVLTARFSQAVLWELRLRVFRHTQALSIDFHERYTSGRIISRQTSDLEAIRELLDEGLSTLVASFSFMSFTLVSIFMLDLTSGLVLTAALVPLILITRWYQHRSAIAYRAARRSSAAMIGHFVEAMTGIRAVKFFRREEANNERYRQLTDRYRKDTITTLVLNSIYQPSVLGIGNIMVAAVVLICGFRALNGQLTVGVMIALVIATKKVFAPFAALTQFYSSYLSAVSGLEKISGFLEEPAAVKPPQHPTPLNRAEGAVRFQQSSFRYRADSPIVLPPFDLTIPAGQTVAIVGATGAGKSTLVKLMARFYDLTTGEVSLDGVPIKELSDTQLREHIVLVTQEAFLFSGTVKENIALGKPQASDAEIRQAARAVGADHFISALPEGYETDIQKRGGLLSAGQRQLISFARAYLADPAVLILDEATSLLDLPSERAIQEALATLQGQRTTIIIAHRLATVLNADRILVMDQGRITEDGSPEELVQADGSFAELFNSWQRSQQSGNDEDEPGAPPTGQNLLA